ncbi:hypothetical protein [Anaerosporobacter faecicola]|uniref:hypothetical protein n=1 Tax=Anaerosporobacter faecicola TaxID=2718714 RepID=UPI00143C601A|nr:hypothetical protein [Anaerosporobacter faecicola]
MSHDTHAAWACAEVAELIMDSQASYFGSLGTPLGWSVYAGREGNRQWPLADGVILAENTTATDVKIALEFKRPNEGVHGVLTALGQSLAYLEKGYDASVVVIPEMYTSHKTPGQHLKRILDSTASDCAVSVYTYSEPDTSALKPFHGKINCVRDISIPSCKKVTSTGGVSSGNVSTLWAHVREGMSYPDAFYKYCLSVRKVCINGEDLSNIHVPKDLVDAVKRIDPSADLYKYLSNTPGDTYSDMTWRNTWFNYYFWNDLMPLYSTKVPYVVNAKSTQILKNDTEYANLFSGRADSIKEKLVDKLNKGTITEDEAWEEYAKKIRKDAHSYREVIDSGLFHIGFLQDDGSLTTLGFKYLEACERVSSSNKGIPLEILRASVLENGQFAAFFHYIYQLSSEEFSTNNFAFTTINSAGKYVFDSKQYLSWIDDKFRNDLHISKSSTLRAGGTRTPFQAEISFLKKLGFIKGSGKRTDFRIGLGLDIDWPKIQNSLLYFQSI